MTNRSYTIKAGRMCLVISDMGTLATHSKTNAAVKHNRNLRKLYRGQVVCIRDIVDINNVIVVAYGADGKKIIDPIKICLRHLQPLKVCLPNVTRESKLSEFQTEMGSEKLHSVIKAIPAVQKTTLKLKKAKMNDFQRYCYRRMLHEKQKIIKAEVQSLRSASN